MSEANGWRERMDRFDRGMEHLLQSQAMHAERLTRHDAEIADLFTAHKHLLTAQIVLTERVDKMAERVDKMADRVDKLAASVAELTEAQKRNVEAEKRTDDRLNALVAVVDDLVRHDKRP